MSPLSLISSSDTTQVFSGYGFGFFASAAWVRVARVRPAARNPAAVRTVSFFIAGPYLAYAGRMRTSFFGNFPALSAAGRWRFQMFGAIMAHVSISYEPYFARTFSGAGWG